MRSMLEAAEGFVSESFWRKYSLTTATTVLMLLSTTLLALAAAVAILVSGRIVSLTTSSYLL